VNKEMQQNQLEDNDYGMDDVGSWAIYSHHHARTARSNGAISTPSSATPNIFSPVTQVDRSIEYTVQNFSGKRYINLKRKTFTGKTVYFSFQIEKVSEAVTEFVRLYKENRQPVKELQNVIRRIYNTLPLSCTDTQTF